MSLLIHMALEHAAKVEARIVGEYLIQHPRWAWMDGMLAVQQTGGRLRIVSVLDNGAYVARPLGAPIDPGGSFTHVRTLRWCYPDLTDPATVGCLQELVRRAHGAVTVSVVYAPFRDEEAGTTPPPYSVFAHGPWPTADRRISVGRSAIEALALALKA